MTYQQTINYLFSRLPMYQKEGKTAYKSNIDNIVSASTILSNPHNKFKSLHIAGTNGKGSVQSFIRNILLKNGYKCDAYISPHLSKFNERIILNNKEVSTKKLYETLIFVKKINNNKPITFFEITTAAAFILFKKSKSDRTYVSVKPN